jgi:tetratricopeptide (TPR) repeat protein
MRWLQTEYLLKGVYLGLLLYAALRLGGAAPSEQLDDLLRVNGPALAGFALALGTAATLKHRAGFRAAGRFTAYVLFLMLESPKLVYAGILGGTLAGTLLLPPMEGEDLFAPILAGGAVVGFLFGVMRRVRLRTARLALNLALAAVLAVGALYLLGRLGEAPAFVLRNPVLFGWQLLLGIPFFYLLTFAGYDEESEIEIGAMCSLLCLGLCILTYDLVSLRFLGYLIPVAAYFTYVMRVLPALRVLKHAFRGLGFARSGNHRRALQALRRALQLDPNNKLAREAFWNLHQNLDLKNIAQDPHTLELIDLDLCLERVATLLVPGKPTPAQLDEAGRLLDLVQQLRPALTPAVDYWRSVALMHARQPAAAAVALERVLDPAVGGHGNPSRKDVLFPAWRLAMTVEELRRTVGRPQLAQPGRRMEAIAAVERALAVDREDQQAFALKRMLYHEVTEADYDAAAGSGLRADNFDHEYVQQLGLALIDDDARIDRGGEYLRLAARGLPALGPSLFTTIAQAHTRAGKPAEARHNYELAKRAGRAIGARELADAERQAYFTAVRMLADDALARGDDAAALENLHLYTESERSGIETLRTLGTLYERRGDPLAAARVTDAALVYNGKDKELLERKERYYYSVLTEDLKARLDWAGAWFDVEYCLRRARAILDGPYDDVEWLDVASHFAKLALVVRPDSLTAKSLQARVRLRFGERDAAVALLEEIRGTAKPEKFATGDDEDAWFVACQLLGDLYLETGKAEQAVACLRDFRGSAKSGARTLLKLGQAYEQLGDVAKAVRSYKQVTAYTGNPLTPEAYQALQRLGA